ncbi:MAG TPA: YraN family protein [Myxococcota bacterium]|nr:YraN family protein [Myxococcota bacterium]
MGSDQKPRDTRALGRAGEDLACEFLQRAGFRILARNVHLRYAELDVVALDGPTLVFVEVRLRRGARFGGAAESVDLRKQRRIAAAAAELLASRRLPRMPRVRFDVVAIDASCAPPRVSHHRDAFSAE